MTSLKQRFKNIIEEFHSSDLLQPKIRQHGIPLDLNKIIVIYGPRRSGKTYLFFQLINELIFEKKVMKTTIVYINFEDDRILPLASKNLNSLIEAYYEMYPENQSQTIYWFFDEIQNIEDWEIFVRRIYDKEKVQIFITGSSSKLLSHEIATSLRGRPVSFPVYPLNFKEFLDFKGLKLKRNFEFSKQRFEIVKLLDEFLNKGRFPEVSLNDDRICGKILQEYYDSLVYKDLVDRYSIRNTALLKDILKHLLTNITKPFSVNSFYKTVKQNTPVSKDTVYEYVSYIEETRYFSFLPDFSYSLKKQRVNPKKIICLDNGLRNRIAFKFSADAGKLAENLVGELLAEKSVEGPNELFYWSEKYEVDFIVKDTDNGLTAINVCYGDEIEDREIDSLLAFKRNFSKKVKILTLITKDIEEDHKEIKMIPLWEWLLRTA